MVPALRFLTCADGSIAAQPGNATGDRGDHLGTPAYTAFPTYFGALECGQYWPNRSQHLWPSHYLPNYSLTISMHGANYHLKTIHWETYLKIPEESDQLRVESGPSEVQHISSWAGWAGRGWLPMDLIQMVNGFSGNSGIRTLYYIYIYWLVVEPPLWKMMEFVSWDDDIPNWMEKYTYIYIYI